MFRYVLVADDTEPELRFEGPFRESLVRAGYTPVGRYRTIYRGENAFAGEILIDPTGTVAASIYDHQGTINVSLHSALADGTYVVTERLPPKSEGMLRGLTLPIPGTRLRFPSVASSEALAEAHARHITEVAEAQRSTVVDGMTAERYVALRHDEQRKRAPLRNFQERVTVTSMLGGLLGAGIFAGVAGLVGLSPVVSASVLLATVLGTVVFGRRIGFGVIAPWLVRRGWGPSWESTAPATSQAGALTVGPVELRDPGVGSVLFAAMPLLAVLFSLAGYVGSVVSGGAAKIWTWLPLVVMAMNSTLVDVVSDRRAFRKRIVKLTVDRDEVRGPRVPVRRERIAGVVVGAERGGDTTLFAVDTRGRVVLRASGTPDDLAVLEAALAPKRQRLPLAHPTGRGVFGAGAATFAAGMAMVLGGVRSDLWIVALGAGVVVAPLLGLSRRTVIEIGADGLLFVSARGQERFLPWTDIAAVDAKDEKTVLSAKDGTAHVVRGALPGTAARVLAAWKTHTEREATRDDAKAARRRVADTAVGAYRVAEEEADALAEAVLDSTESQSVRVRAARKLARLEDATARAETAEQVADPAVKRELSRDDKG